MKQYRITSADLNQDSPDDCYLAPDDPIYEFKIMSSFGGLGATARLNEYRAAKLPTIIQENRGQIQREQDIKPGTDEWFKLWFGNRNTQ
jgi:hypothetical protein